MTEIDMDAAREWARDVASVGWVTFPTAQNYARAFLALDAEVKRLREENEALRTLLKATS